MRTSGGGGGISDFGHPRTRGGGGVKKRQIFADVLYGWPLKEIGRPSQAEFEFITTELLPVIKIKNGEIHFLTIYGQNFMTGPSGKLPSGHLSAPS